MIISVSWNLHLKSNRKELVKKKIEFYDNIDVFKQHFTTRVVLQLYPQ